ncbi:cell division protein FtsA [Candidatus Jorgensenbacteria bacterium RIFCSPLOWO2_02_FULL_45_12]|uniref:Cell division protein FtsA n=2 Tax=Candidatus Joergenseniibacteriota TaxID=1752739 RepID=A0A1F6BMS3_9BACT|nr:MAG: Cell division protein ftsA [Candidatus Jorgensenbacteria bacterium GW2011_GWA2_45_9]OGG38226.1 MAG: cell division protein FtsA [Candidatus Jorgensenbacteria bacterium RIFCSPHIGHO2_02_FULL_45_20]OGG42604.1 MAG: cell division protein FtsA [Candidatus Jorgensenbacteria bacterium RIFCSPLOWO2_02_FULL_45_12]
MSNIITGIDIGSSQIKIVVAGKKKGALAQVLSVVKQPSSGFHKGVVVDPEEATRVLRDIVLDLQNFSKKAAQNVFVNVNSEYVKVRNSRGISAVARADREIQQDDVDRVIQASQAIKLQPNYMVVHNITREFFVDDVGDIQDPIGMTGNRLEVSTLVVEAFAPQMNSLLKTLERVGMRVSGLVFNPLAAAHSVLSKKQKDLGVLMIDFGFDTTSFVVYEENKISHAKSIPVGMRHITNDIAVGLRVAFDSAERIKLTYGNAMSKDVNRKDVIQLSEFDPLNRGEVSKRFVAEIIEVRLAEILELVNNELKVLGRSVQIPAGIVITGGGTKLPGITDLVKQELKFHTQIGFPNLEPFEIMNPTYKELLDDPEFATALGLVRIETGEKHVLPDGTWGSVKNFFKNFVP